MSSDEAPELPQIPEEILLRLLEAQERGEMVGFSLVWSPRLLEKVVAAGERTFFGQGPVDMAAWQEDSWLLSELVAQIVWGVRQKLASGDVAFVSAEELRGDN